MMSCLFAIAQESPLSTGKWVKMTFDQEGVYQLGFSELDEMGFNVTNLDPNTISIFGLPGGMLPQSNDVNGPSSLTEIPIKIVSQNSNSFTPGDQIFFYVDAVDQLSFSEQERLFEIKKNLYSDEIAYFITASDDQGLRVGMSPDLGPQQSSFDWHDKLISHEVDQNNILNSGREWFGERITNNTLRFDHDISNSSAGNSYLTVDLMAQSFTSTSMSIDVNDASTQVSFNEIPNTQYGIKGDEQRATIPFQANDGNLSIEMTYDRNGTTNSTAYLNKYILQIPQENILNDNFLLINSASLDQSMSEFIVEATNHAWVWNITDPMAPLEQETRRINNEVRFSTFTDELVKFWVFDPEKAPSPTSFESIENQNLLGSNTPEMIILTHPLFESQAEAMANFRRQHDQMDVLVTSLEEVYNEFSAGRPDITAIRNFVRTKYEQSNILKYLLILGKGSYDYKDRIDDNTNFIPTYESRNSLHPLFSFSSDDYFGFLEQGEGDWIESRAGDHDLEIGIGRIPVTTKAEANQFLEKWISYQTQGNTRGDWKTKLSFVADDGDGNIHQRDSDFLARMVDNEQPEFEIKKIFLDAFRQESTPNGETSPEATKQLIKAVNEGRLLINFTGHGAENGWMQERILTFDIMEQWNNADRLPFLVTATCEFGRNDDPEVLSGAEYLLTKANSGAIGLVTTARPVFSSTNFRLNQALYEVMLTQDNGQYLTLGDIIRYTKNNSLAGSINRNFILLGDPSMRLAFPNHSITVEKINQQEITGNDTIRSFERVKFEGVIANQPQFNGSIQYELIDKARQKSTLGSEGSSFNYSEKDLVLSRGEATVNNGRFEINTQIPQNINYSYGNGRLQLYAFSEEAESDAFGVSENFIIGGTSTEAEADNNAPQGQLFLNDTSGVLQSSYPNSVQFLALLEDENGINISSNSIGQSIQLIVNDSLRYELNENFSYLKDSDQKGLVSFSINNLPAGANTIRLLFWDNRGNGQSKNLSFQVNEKTSLFNEIKNYPNPLENQTKFFIAHKLSGELLDVTIRLLNVNGGEIARKLERINYAPAEITLDWDIGLEMGKQLEKGVYIYEVQISSRTSGLSESLRKKLIISY